MNTLNYSMYLYNLFSIISCSSMQKITPFLWFVNNADEAAKFYASIFKGKVISNTKLNNTPSGPNTYLVTIKLANTIFTLINGGNAPGFTTFSAATSFVINCKNQKEVNYYWNSLLKGGGKPSQCGWLTDKYGVTWQVVPEQIPKYLAGPDKQGRDRAMKAMLKMVKLDINKIKNAYIKK